VKGVLPPAQIARLRREAAVTVLTSRYETFPMTAMEAMGFGCPLVASRIPSIEEFAEHDRNALLFQSGDSEDLARNLEALLDEPDRAARLGAQAARDSERHYSPRVIAAATADFYRDVLAGAARSGAIGAGGERS
jgi:glycosyltransferase involved in cell wall biosynthesis